MNYCTVIFKVSAKISKFVSYYYKHCVKDVQIRSNFWSVFSRIRTEYGPEITPYLDTFQAVKASCYFSSFEQFWTAFFKENLSVAASKFL